MLKIAFVENEKVEHIWVADIDATVFRPMGTIANEPSLAGVLFMERVEFHPSQISDWLYVEDCYMVGGFTIQVIRSLLSEAERAEYDAHAPYKFKS